ncbi:uncharacterized protein TNCV_2662721 [Trichonephila clavipes]|nr:uncharacterized protein TNCV_2662721 [Trichonephila clavipes]
MSTNENSDSEGLGWNPGEKKDVCKCIVPSRQGGTLNSCRIASPLARLVEEEKRWEASDHPQSILPLNWGGIEPNRTVSCMVLKAMANDRHHLALCHEFRGPRSGLCRSVKFFNEVASSKTSLIESSGFDNPLALAASWKVEYLVPLIINKYSYETTPFFLSNDSSSEPKGHVKEKTREPVTMYSGSQWYTVTGGDCFEEQ